MMKRILMFACALFVFLQVNAFAEYADPLKNPWVFTMEESWPGTEPIEGNGMTFKLKVPVDDSDLTTFDLWQMDIPKDTSTNLVLHPIEFIEDDASFSSAQDAIFKTVILIEGRLEVTFSNCKTPYMVNAHDAVHLMPGTPHQFKATEDAVLMVYCYGKGVNQDKDKSFIRAYFDEAATDEFTVFPKEEALICDQNIKDTNYILSYNFPGPNHEIRRSLGSSISSSMGLNPFANNHLKIAAFETNDQMEFIEFHFLSSLDYWPHKHKDFLECIIITHKEATFWMGQGKENGQINVNDPNFGTKFTPAPGSEEKHPANSARNGDGIRVKPGYVMYFPAGVPHSMLDTEEGNLWYNTAQPIGSFTDATLGRSNKIYQISEELPD